jgi:D-xylose transport system permease protein
MSASTTNLSPKNSTAASVFTKQLRANLQTYALIMALIVIWIIFDIATGGLYLSAQNFSNLFRQMTVTAFLSVGMVLVIVTGGIDLSVGRLAGWVSVWVAYFQANIWNHVLPEQQVLTTILSVLVGLGIGTIYGIAQGYIIAYLNVTAFIVTLGSMWILNGLILIRTGGKTIPSNQPLFSKIGQGYLPDWAGWILAGLVVALLFYMMFTSRRRKVKFGFEVPSFTLDLAKTIFFSLLVVGFVFYVNQYSGVSNPVLILAFFAVVVSYVSNNTRFGRYAYAIGGNREAARLSGININKNIFMIFVLMGFLCGVSGVVMASYLGYGTIAAGSGYELYAIAACILGGTSTLGGVGTISGAMIGALVLASLTNGLQIMNVASSWQYVLNGVVLVVAVLADVYLKKNR